MIGHRIVVTVLSIGRDQVRLGIEAPADVEVHREEVYRSIQQANRIAAESGGDVGQLAGVLAASPTPSGGSAPATPSGGSAPAAPSGGSPPAEGSGAVGDRPAGGRAPGAHDADRSEVATNGTATP
jgi:carbon storage regulator